MLFAYQLVSRYRSKTGLVFSDVLPSSHLKLSGDYYKMFIFIYIPTASRFIPTTTDLQIDANITFASKDLSRRRNLFIMKYDSSRKRLRLHHRNAVVF